jgi:hypothetical protein
VGDVGAIAGKSASADAITYAARVENLALIQLTPPE